VTEPAGAVVEQPRAAAGLLEVEGLTRAFGGLRAVDV
jgi:hypothetical protein